MGLATEFISDPDRLQQLEPDWRSLWSLLEDTTPFQSPDWILPWWRRYGDTNLFSFAFWNDGQLFGLGPLYIFSSAADSTRRLFLIGTGITDYLDAILRPDFRPYCWTVLVEEISRRREQWDECDSQRLRPGSVLLQQIESGSGLFANASEQEPCVAVDCSGSAAERMLKAAKVYARKLSSKKPLAIDDATPDSFEDMLCAFEQLHERRWQAKGFPGVLAEERDRNFHHQVASRVLRAGTLMLHALRVSGKIVSVIYGLQRGARTYSYLSGFDPAYRRQSVGTILVGHAIEQSLKQVRSFDFLKGQEPYKYRC